ADVAGDGHGVLLAGSASGDRARLALLDPLSGAVLRSTELGPSLTTGIRVAAGDLDGDGRDEIAVTPAFGGDSGVHFFNGALDEIGGFPAYNWMGAGMNVALATRIGLPVTASPRTMRLKVRKRQSVIVAWFHDAAG